MFQSNFYTALHMRSGRVFSPAGAKTKVTYQLQIEPDGNRKLVETGVKDVYEEIQSYKESSLIENIVKRAANGDLTALSQRQGVYLDTTLLPTDLITANEAVRRAEAVYKSLPADVRSEYGGFKEFVQAFGTLEGVQAFYDKLTGKKSEDSAPAGDPAPVGDPAPGGDGNVE